jgi:hypothetical protein
MLKKHNIELTRAQFAKAFTVLADEATVPQKNLGVAFNDLLGVSFPLAE